MMLPLPGEPADQWQSRQITAWLAGPPHLKNEPVLLMALIDDLLEMFQPYDVKFVHSGEPRNYRLTPKGRAALFDLLSERRTDLLQVGSETGPVRYDAPEQGVASSFIWFGSTSDPRSVVTIGLSIARRSGSRSEVLAEILTFVKRWFVRMEASAAFVSWTALRDRWYGDGTAGNGPTEHEREKHRQEGIGNLFEWPVLTRYARGAFWGNGLGPQLCERLGGRARVLREAPVPIAEPLGEGVWLQLSGEPPPPEDELARLKEYLAPLLNWGKQDIDALLPPVAPAMLRPPLPRVPPSTTPIPFRFVQDSETDVVLNLHLRRRPSPNEQAAVEAAIRNWRRDAEEGFFGDSDFHYVGEPSLDRQNHMLRWSADLGRVQPMEAIERLALRLGAVPLGAITELVIGQEEAD